MFQMIPDLCLWFVYGLGVNFCVLWTFNVNLPICLSVSMSFSMRKPVHFRLYLVLIHLMLHC